jgi:CBS domain-containing protein
MRLSEVPLRQIPVVEPQTALSEVIYLLRNEPLRAVALVGDEQYMGVFRQEDLESGLIPAGADPDTLAVGPYASGPRVSAPPDADAADALALMRRHDLKLLPVVSRATLKGVVTREDLERGG